MSTAAPGPLGNLAGLWWRTIPAGVARVFRTLGLGLADGGYLAGKPVLGALTPPAALLVGLVIGKLHLAGAPGAAYTYTFSLPAMAVMAMIGVLGGGLGAWLVLGYAVGDLVLTPPFAYDPTFSIVEMGWRDQVPPVLSYLLLAQLLVTIPLLTSLCRRSLPARLGAARGPLGSLLGFPVLAVLVYLWTQAVPTLIRPVFTWYAPNATPPVAAMQPLQQDGWVLIIVACAGLVARIALETSTGALSQDLSFSAATASSRTGWAPLRGTPIPAVFRASLVTFLMAGVIDAPAEAVIVLVTLALVFWVRDLVSRGAAGWVRIIARVPLLIRLLVGIAVTFLIASPLVNYFWTATFDSGGGGTLTFVPVLISAVIGLLIFTVLVPPQPSRAKP